MYNRSQRDQLLNEKAVEAVRHASLGRVTVKETFKPKSIRNKETQMKDMGVLMASQDFKKWRSRLDVLKQIVRQPNPHEIQFMKGAKFSMAPRSVSQQQPEYQNA